MKRIPWVEQCVVLHASAHPPHILTRYARNKLFTKKYTLKEVFGKVSTRHNWAIVWLPKSEAFAAIDLLGAVIKTGSGHSFFLRPATVISAPTIEAVIMAVMTSHQTI